MEEIGNGIGAVVSKEIAIDGITLVIVASKTGSGEWQLCVQNEFGINSNWLEFFPDAQQAIDAGMIAIEEDGVESFMSVEGFEYLF